MSAVDPDLSTTNDAKLAVAGHHSGEMYRDGEYTMRVLIAVEDMTYGHAIAEFVGKHKWSKDTQFKVIHAVHPNEIMYTADTQYCCSLATDMEEERDRKARSLVKGIAAQIQSQLPGVAIEEEIVPGNPNEVILDQAEEWKSDMIVVGSHGRSGFSRFFLGSVSLSVLSHAHCSIMIVRIPKTAESANSKEKEAVKAQQQTLDKGKEQLAGQR